MSVRYLYGYPTDSMREFLYLKFRLDTNKHKYNIQELLKTYFVSNASNRMSDEVAFFTCDLSGGNISSDLYFGLSDITELSTPENIRTISELYMFNCRNLKLLSLHTNISSVQSQAFFNCLNLTELVIPNYVKWIGDDCFHECNSLSLLVIPDSIEYIGDGAFYGIPTDCTIIYNGDLTSYTTISDIRKILNDLYVDNVYQEDESQLTSSYDGVYDYEDDGTNGIFTNYIQDMKDAYLLVVSENLG